MLAMLKQGGFAMIPLVLCSVVVVAITVWRIIANRRAVCDPKPFLREVEDDARRHGRDLALARCLRSLTPLARVCAAGLERHDVTGDRLRAAIADAVRREIRLVEGGLVWLATIGSTAPFLGLLGTVLGVLQAFWHIGESGRAGSAVVASGVAEALIATAAGLVVAIPAVVAYNVLSSWADHFGEDLESAGEEIARIAESLPAGRPEFLRREGP